MTILVPLVMFGWIPVVLILCALLPTRRAVIASFVIAWMFLPEYQYHIQGLPAYSKMSATCGGVLLAALFFDISKLLSFRPSWIDLPMIVWCLCPCASSLSNGLGLYDGVSGAFAQTVTWGMPYFIGRLYLSDMEGLKELAIGIFIGGLVYVPLCLYEIRMSPQLHNIFYGFYQHDFAQTMRMGGWRPTVFMEHGLMVSMWMSMASLIGVWLWWTGAVKNIGPVPMAVLAPVLLVTAVLCKSTGALLLLAAGLMALAALKQWGSRGLVWLLIAITPIYCVVRATGVWSGSQLVAVTQSIGDEESTRRAAESLGFRLTNENKLIGKAMEQPILGWGGWERNQVVERYTRTVVDGAWIDAMGKYGIVGLSAFLMMLLLAPVLLLKKFPPKVWATPTFATVSALLMVNVLYMIDNLPNAMVNPIYALSAGGLAGLLVMRLPKKVPARVGVRVRRVHRMQNQAVGA